MFNNPYNPYFNNNTYGQGYNNQYSQQNYTQMPQQQIQPTQQQIQSQQQVQSSQQPTNFINTNKIYVSGIEEVMSKIQPPNSDFVYTNTFNTNIEYHKKVDSIGKFTLKTYFKTEQNENQESEIKEKEIDTSEYVLKSDFESLGAKLEEKLEAKLEEKLNKFASKKNEIISIPEVKK